MADDQTSSANESIIIDVYPWAVPTEEQMRWFDSLPAAEKRSLIAEAIREGEESGISDRTPAEILAVALSRKLD